MTTNKSALSQVRLRLSQPADVLAMIPYLLGFQPVESLVMMVVQQDRVALTARVDLPQPTRHDEVEAIADHFAAVADHHDAESVLISVFSGQGRWADQVVTTVTDGFSCPVVHAAHCNDYGFREWDGVRWSPIRAFDPSGTQAAAAAVVAGMAIHGEREQLRDRIAPAPAAALAAVAVAAEEVQIPDDPDDRKHLMANTVARCLISGTVDDHDCARLALLATDIDVRDVAWLSMTREASDDCFALWASVAARVPTVLSAAPICLAGAAAWLSGNGALAWCCVDRARAEHPSYRMIGLLDDLLTAAVHPRSWTEIAAACAVA